MHALDSPCSSLASDKRFPPLYSASVFSNAAFVIPMFTGGKQHLLDQAALQAQQCSID